MPRLPLLLQAPVLSQSGYGAHARDIFNAVFDSQDWDVYLSPTGWGGTSSSTNFSSEFLDKVMFAVSRQVPSKDFLWFQLGIPTEFEHRGKVSIGITAGAEGDVVSRLFVEGCQKMDCVIVPSHFTKQVFIRSGVTATLMPIIFEPFSESDYDISKPAELQVPTAFNFLTVGQWLGNNSLEDRKGVGFLIREFTKLFHGRKDVGLILKIFCKNLSSADRFVTTERIRSIQGVDSSNPPIYLLHGDLTSSEMWGLYKSPKIGAFILPTHGEGFGRPLLEAAVAGLPVLTTGWGGQTDFLQRENHTLFDYNLRAIPKSQYQLPIWCPGMRWAVPDEDQIRYHMKRIVENQEPYRAKAQKAVEGLKVQFSTKAFKESLLLTLDRFRQELIGSKIIRLS